MKLTKTILSLFVLFALTLTLVTPANAKGKVGTAVCGEKAKITKVIDGDTYWVKTTSGDKFKVRLIGVDTPESVNPNSSKNTTWGKKISKWAKKHLKGKKVFLEYDMQRSDIYNRVLAYIYLNANKCTDMLNKKLVKKGYARAVYYYPNKMYKKVFEKLQKWAKKHKKGFWKDGYSAAFPS